MRQDIGQKIRSEIRGDENLIWCGQPKGGYRWYAADIIRVPFSLIWLGGVSFIAFMSLTSPFLPIYLKAVFFLAVAIGLYFNSVKWIDKKLREQTFYGLTEKQVIIISEFIRRCVNKFDLNDLGEITLTPEEGDRGTISFGLERFKHVRTNIKSIMYRVPVNEPFLAGEGASYMLFESIEHARDVYNKIAEARQKRINNLKLSGPYDDNKKRARGNLWAYVKIAFITIPAVLVFGFVFIPQIFGPRQQLKEVQQRMGTVTSQAITSVAVSLVSSQNKKTAQLDPTDYGKVAEYLRNMRPIKNLRRGPRHYYREVDIYAGQAGHFRLTLMTGESLNYKAVANVNIMGGISEDSRAAFFDANDFWNWLKERPVVAQQGDGQNTSAVQDEKKKAPDSPSPNSFKEEELLRRFRNPENLSLSAARLHSEGLKAFGNSNYELAVALWLIELEKDSRNANTMNNISIGFARLEQWNTAEYWARTALKKDANFGHAHVSRGIALNGLGRYAEAETEIIDGIRLGYQDGAAHMNLGYSYHMQGKRFEAEQEFRLVEKKYPDFPRLKKLLKEYGYSG